MKRTLRGSTGGAWDLETLVSQLRAAQGGGGWKRGPSITPADYLAFLSLQNRGYRASMLQTRSVRREARNAARA